MNDDQDQRVNELIKILTDEDLDMQTRVDIFVEAAAPEADKQRAAEIVKRAMTMRAVDALASAGVVHEQSPSVMDITVGDLQAYAAIYGLIAKWDTSLQLDKRLGDVMMTLPRAYTQPIERWLRGRRMIDDSELCLIEPWTLNEDPG